MSSFIENLRRSIDCTAVCDPIGKYGKPVLNESKTAEEKLEKLLLADPKSLEDIIAYVKFVDSMDAMKNNKVRKKVKAMLRDAKYDYSEQELARAIDALRRVETKRIALIVASIALGALVLTGDIYWYICKVQFWGLFGKIMWWGFLLPWTLAAAALLPELSLWLNSDHNPFK